MIKLVENKYSTEHKLTEALPLPQKAYIPLTQHTGACCDVLAVKAGDTVLRGQLLGQASSPLFSPVHASISGKVVSIQNWPHPVLDRCRAVVIESDGQDKPVDAKPRSEQEIKLLSPDQIRAIVQAAGIVGLGGAAFPTHIKLFPPKPVDTLIVNGAECEPYLTADSRLMEEKTADILLGVALAARCLGVKNIIIAIEENKPKAIKKFAKAVESGLPIKVKVLASSYPQGGEKQLIKNVLGREVPRGQLPYEVGVVVQNVATAYAVYEAVYKGKPLYERVVTVTGSCLNNPKNLLARIGTPIKDLIDFCGPLIEPPAKIIAGGPMMGVSQYTDQVPVIKATSGILLLTKKEAAVLEESPCIRCGECIRQCPMNLMPCMINLAALKEMWDSAKEYGASDCIECGSCSYVCPSNRYLVQSIRRAKLSVPK